MGYGDHGEPDEYLPATGFTGHMNQLLTIVVRLVGLVVLSVGLWAGGRVLLEGWALYESPERIERLSTAIEQGSNLDALFATVSAPVPEAAAPPAEGEEPVLAVAVTPPPAGPSLRLSYFAAWFVALMLLFVIGMLAMSAISTGGQLALRELPVRRIARDVSREVRRLGRAA